MKIEYSNNYLMHENPFHDPKTGQFTFAQGANVAKQLKNVSDQAYQYVDKHSKTKKGPRVDLSKMSDQELRDILTREEMERRYDMYFNTPQEKKGAKFTMDALQVASLVGGILVAGLTAASIATAIKDKWDEKKRSGKQVTIKEILP